MKLIQDNIRFQMSSKLQLCPLTKRSQFEFLSYLNTIIEHSKEERERFFFIYSFIEREKKIQ